MQFTSPLVVYSTIVFGTNKHKTYERVHHSPSRFTPLIKIAFFNVMSFFLDVLARRPEIAHTSNPSHNEQSEENTANSNSGNCVHGSLTWSPRYNRGRCDPKRAFPFVSYLSAPEETDGSSTQTTVAQPAWKTQKEQEIIRLTQQLITSVTTLDFDTYSKLVDSHVTAFEPEANGNLVEGVEFHKFYFDNVLRQRNAPTNTTILSPHVHILSADAACISYVRLTQRIGSNGEPVTDQSEETRVWQLKSGHWVNVHVHRSSLGKGRN